MTLWSWILRAEFHAENARRRAECRRALEGLAASILCFTFIFSLAVIWGCATTPAGRARQAAVIQKTAVDGVGNAYLNYCKVVRLPACIAADKTATETGTPQTKADRVQCLRPCDSATAEKIQTAVDVVRTAQSGLFELLRSGNATEAELQAQRRQLARAADQLSALIREAGVLNMLGDAVGGGR